MLLGYHDECHAFVLRNFLPGPEPRSISNKKLMARKFLALAFSLNAFIEVGERKEVVRSLQCDFHISVQCPRYSDVGIPGPPSSKDAHPQPASGEYDEQSVKARTHGNLRYRIG